MELFVEELKVAFKLKLLFYNKETLKQNSSNENLVDPIPKTNFKFEYHHLLEEFRNQFLRNKSMTKPVRHGGTDENLNKTTFDWPR